MMWFSSHLTRRDAIRAGVGMLAGLTLRRFPSLSDPEELVARPIPSSGEMLPVIGIGTARRYDVGTADDERAPLRAVLKQFSDMGGRLVDTAPSYGRAEPVVGDLVADIGNRKSLFLATKVRSRTAAEGVAEMNRSFELLHTDVIDLMQVHNLVGVGEMLPVLREWKAEGRIRYLGATTSRSSQYEEFVATMKSEDMDFVQVNYSLADRGAADRILPLAAERGMAVLVNLPYGRGRLFSAVGDRPLPDWAAQFDCGSWGQFFLKYVVSHPAVTCAIPGTAKISYLEDNLGAAMGRLPTPALRKKMERFFDDL